MAHTIWQLYNTAQGQAILKRLNDSCEPHADNQTEDNFYITIFLN